MKIFFAILIGVLVVVLVVFIAENEMNVPHDMMLTITAGIVGGTIGGLIGGKKFFPRKFKKKEDTDKEK